MNSQDLSALQAYGGVNQGQIIKALYAMLALEAAGISVMPNLKSKHLLAKLLVGKGAKPYTGTFKSKADVNSDPRELAVEKAQRDLTIDPSQYLGTFLEKNRGRGENPNNPTIPFAEVLWQSVVESLAQEISLETVYFGEGKAAFVAYAAGDAYAVGDLVKYTQDGELRYFRCLAITTAGQNPDTHPAKWEYAGGRALCKGFKAHLDAAETAGDITPVSTGALTSSNAYDQVIKVWRALPEPVKNGKGGVVYTSQDTYEKVVDQYESAVSKNFEHTNGVAVLPKTDGKAIIKPVNWLSGSSKIIASAHGNLWMGTDQSSDMNTIKVMEQMYTLDAGISFMIGFQIADLDVIRVNDQD